MKTTSMSASFDKEIVGSEGADYLLGTQGDDLILGLGGGDYILADVIPLDNQGGDDRVLAGPGDDTVRAFGGDNEVFGEGGNDVLVTADGDDVIDGGPGNDDIQSGRGQDVVTGGPGDDKLRGGEGDDLIDGGDGNDRLVGGSDDDQLLGGAGDDRLEGREGRDVLWGGEGNDVLNGDQGRDVLNGGPGNDRLVGGSGEDTADYSDATGPVRVSLADGKASGAWGKDELQTIENLTGSAFNDRLTGDDAANRLDGLAGNDKLKGNDGADSFVLEPGSGRDCVLDFTGTEDRLDLSAFFEASGKSASDVFGPDDQLNADDAAVTLTKKGLSVDLTTLFAITDTGIDVLVLKGVDLVEFEPSHRLTHKPGRGLRARRWRGGGCRPCCG